MPMPGDYAERVYAGVLGKIIGVYLGRPVEGWDHERIISELGKIYYYVNDRWQPEADIRRIPTIGEVAEFPNFPPFCN
jgi:ADP-ribosylglycohydrolase